MVLSDAAATPVMVDDFDQGVAFYRDVPRSLCSTSRKSRPRALMSELAIPGA